MANQVFFGNAFDRNGDRHGSSKDSAATPQPKYYLCIARMISRLSKAGKPSRSQVWGGLFRDESTDYGKKTKTYNLVTHRPKISLALYSGGEMSTQAPIVSVLMPVYNGEKYVAESVQSILN